MPGLVMEPRVGEPFAAPVARKESLARQGSPRSPLSPRSPRSDSLDLAIAADTSIEQLYNNVCEMQSSDRSPSRASLFSYGAESRIDSELRLLVGDLAEVTNKEEQQPKVVSKPAKESPRTTKPRTKSPQLGHGPTLLRQARDMASSGENPRRALKIARRALRSFEEDGSAEKPGLDIVMCLHVSAALQCGLGRYEEAVPALERSIEIAAIEDGEDHALAKFAGCMQLGDTYAMMGQIENSLLLYSAGLEIQRQVLGERDPRLGETCRYVAEANVQALRFDEAERLCRMALDIHRESGTPGSIEEAADRRLMGLVCESKGDHEAALEHYVSAGMSMASNGQELEVASIDRSIGDAYLSLSRYDEAVFAYRKALAAFKACRGESHPAVASVLVRLGDLHNKVGQFRESKSYCESALKIYHSARPNPRAPDSSEEIASGLIDVSAIYQSMNELGPALRLLKKALRVFGEAPGNQNAAAGIEAQMGVMHYMMGNYKESYEIFKSSVLKFRASSEKKSALFGVALNQMGLACVQLCSINEAAELFEEAKSVLEKEYGPDHPDTLGVCSNLAGTYDAMGRLDDAIEILDYVVGMREEKLGTANPEVDDEKRRLAQLLKEAGRARNRKPMSLETLLDTNSGQVVNVDGIEVM